MISFTQHTGLAEGTPVGEAVEVQNYQLESGQPVRDFLDGDIHLEYNAQLKHRSFEIFPVADEIRDAGDNPICTTDKPVAIISNPVILDDFA
jgi:hypothetical protein